MPLFAIMYSMDEIEQNQNPNSQKILETIKSFETDYKIEVISDPESLRITEIAELDKELFGEHKSLSEEDFRTLVQKGGILFGHINEDDQLISEASLVLSTNPEGSSSLERKLPDWLGYCDGAAVSKSYRGKGLQKQLLQARELVAHEMGKEGISASVRQRNVASIKSMLNTGFVMIADAPNYYGDTKEDARVVMLKDFEIGNPLQDLDSDEENLEASLKGVIDATKIAEKLSDNADIIALGISQSSEVDEELNTGIGHLLRSGYAGVSCQDIDIGDSDSESADALVFVRIASLPAEIASRLQSRQSEVQQLLH